MPPSCAHCVYTNVEVWPIPQDPDPRHTRCQTKHEAWVGVIQGQPEKNARSQGVSRSVGVAVVPWPLSRWPVGNLLTRTEDWRGRGEGSDQAQWFAAKRTTCLVVLPKTVAQCPSSSLGRRQTCVSLGLCVGTPLSLSYPQSRSVWINFCKKKRQRWRLKGRSRGDMFDKRLYADSECCRQLLSWPLLNREHCLVAFHSCRGTFSHFRFHFIASGCERKFKIYLSAC